MLWGHDLKKNNLAYIINMTYMKKTKVFICILNYKKPTSIKKLKLFFSVYMLQFVYRYNILKISKSLNIKSNEYCDSNKCYIIVLTTMFILTLYFSNYNYFTFFIILKQCLPIKEEAFLKIRVHCIIGVYHP